MTYDPGRDPTDPLDVNPRGRRAFPDSGSGMGVLLGILALLVIGGFIFYAMSDNATVATNDSRPTTTAPSTTGSAPRETTGAPMPTQRPATPAPAPK